uniref:Uncharacterized protein n=1 Tax=Tanacetum cinerariifolium TaxID=118510 RepID=A0A699KIU9_TANCI|nr:hypothetical protein [Tanacetum cinerariifolium]
MVEEFSKTPLVIYQNYLREFWCTVVVVRATPPTEDSEPISLKESGIRFIVQNRGTKIDIREIIYNNLVTRLLRTPRKTYVAYPRFISCVLERLLNIDYDQDITLGSTPSVLSKQNFNQNSSEVQPIKLIEYMLSVVSHQALVSPTLSLEKAGKKKKSQTMTKLAPKSQGPEVSGVPVNVTKGK